MSWEPAGSLFCVRIPLADSSKANRSKIEKYMKFLSLELIKMQSRIDGNDEDTYLGMLGEAAERKLFNDTQRTYEEIKEANNDEWPTDLTLAALLLTSHWYKNREDASNVSMYLVPNAYEALYMPYRKGTYSSVEGEE